ncbi:MAG TPA: phospho-N-acetylmuramoyl-pentapeptide-transferase [Armatimonadetes bacterium]|jgi:phospho-N-acetylmuramoyl-pentapeptide-transferase|nr:phospho-N-acetylmuramoyl-pentapeptide-transferase [Armatimonadota bacterium]
MILPVSMAVLLPFAALCAAVAGAVATYVVLVHLRASGVRQAIREDGPQSHLAKGSTPSMGGVAVIGVLLLVTLVCASGCGLLGIRLYLVMGLTLVFALVGFIDDYAKVKSHRSAGWGARYRISIELLLAAGVMIILTGLDGAGAQGWHQNSLWLWVPLGVFIIVGGPNAFNLTDGLDGLAGGLTAICGAALAIILLLLGDAQMALVAAVTAGAAAGFLWLNAHPARIFMGDVGSLGLGACLSSIAVVGRVELVYALLAGVFVIETVSVIIQVGYFKLSGGKRVFRMAPFHHHLELGGWPEPTVVTRLWLIGAACALLGTLLAVGCMVAPG